ncbi:hypothetical protein D3C72_2432990 [compost metagenome]
MQGHALKRCSNPALETYSCRGEAFLLIAGVGIHLEAVTRVAVKTAGRIPRATSANA